MKVIGTIKSDEVPEGPTRAFGVWTSLAVQAVEAHKKGEVLVVLCADRHEYKKMANGMSERIRQLGFGRQFTVVDEPDGVRVYMKLVDEISHKNGLTVAPAEPPRRIRKRA